jgi:hypothetical protein
VRFARRPGRVTTLEEVEPMHVIHLYDTDARRIRCGAAGHIGSTKYPRQVTCEACLKPRHAEADPETEVEADDTETSSTRLHELEETPAGLH